MSRKKNFEQNEILKLISLYKEHAEILNSKFNTCISNRKKKEKWAEITSAVNSIGIQRRSTEELKHKWKDLLTRAKRDYSNRRHPRTGGGPKPQEGPYTDLVLDIIGPTSVTLTGICDGGESSVDGIEQQEEQSDSPPNAPIRDTQVTTLATEEQPSQSAEMTLSPEGPAAKRSRRSSSQQTREELHRELLEVEIKKVNLEVKKTELEISKLEKENVKLELEILLLQQQQQLQVNLQVQQPQLQQQFLQQQSFQVQGLQTFPNEDKIQSQLD